jgi:zinc/manganese transport system substrate-binding protein
MTSSAFYQGLCRALLGLAVVGLPLFSSASPAESATTTIRIVAAESQYANVAQQIGGQYVSVSAIISNPNVDPHTFEVSTSVASEIGGANIVIENGLGYDSFVTNIENASPHTGRFNLNVESLLRLSSSTFNPHLWYSPTTMPEVASSLAKELEKLQPQHSAYFQTQLTKFDQSLQPWLAAIASFKEFHARASVAVTEPVADYLLNAMGLSIKTPDTFQADIMNGVDPSPEAISSEENLLTNHEVKVFAYNEQVTDSLTASLKTLAQSHHVPIVGVYETLPAGYSYQNWMLAETLAITKAVERSQSTEKL